MIELGDHKIFNWQHESEGEKPPEHALLVEVLRRAILDLIGSNFRDRRDAYEWFVAEESAEHSFRWLCDCVDYEANKILEALKPHLDAERTRRCKFVRWGKRGSRLARGWQSNVKIGKTRLTHERLHGKKQRSLGR